MARKSHNALVSINGIELAKSYEALKSSSRMLLGDARGVAYWSDEGGGSRFTPIVTAAFLTYLRETIDGKHPDVTANFSQVTSRYDKWKASVGFPPYHWNRTGILRESFKSDVQNIGQKRTMGVVTIDSSEVTPAGGYGKNPKLVPVVDVFKWLEFGTWKMPGRPLLSSALLKFTTIHFPKMVSSLQTSIHQYIKKNHSKHAGPSRESSGSVSSVMGQSSLVSDVQKLAAVNVDTDFSEKQIQDAFVKGEVASGPSVYESELKGMEKQLLKDLQSQGLDPAEIQRIMEGMKGL